MKQEINDMLNPPGLTYPDIKTEYGSYVDLSKKSSSVTIALIDDDGKLVVTDITHPLPISQQP